MRSFSVESDAIALPRGAWAKGHRVKILWRDRTIAALSQGDYRAYLYPVFTPAGFSVTSESPIDHPHHQSVWIGTDHLTARLPFSSDQIEEANYNFYVNDIFQGRAPGRILGVSVENTELADDHLRIIQTLHWQGPQEWGAPDRRLLATETRTYDIHPGEQANIIAIRSQLRPAEWDIRIGPTRHAYFGVRLVEGLRVVDGGAFLDSANRTDADAISAHDADWVDASGLIARGHRAGIAVLLHPSIGGRPWSASEYGTIAVNPLVEAAASLTRGQALDLAIRIVVHDGDADEARLADLVASFRDGT